MITEKQSQTLGHVTELLQQAFPDLSLLGIVKQHLLPHLLGPLPRHSNLKDGYAINKVALAAVGASVICYGDDPETGERVVLVIDRKEVNPEGLHYHGVLGGYVNLDAGGEVKGVSVDTLRGEQPSEGAVREAAEESKNGNNQSVVQLTPDRVELLAGGINYQVTPPAAYFVYTAELTGAEILHVKKNICDNEKDKASQRSAVQCTEGEVFGMHLMRVQEAIELKETQFFYRHTWQTLQTALEKMQGSTRQIRQVSPRPTTARP